MAIEKPKAPRAPQRPTAAPGVPVPTAYTGPSKSLQGMATQIGRDRALSEFYKALVGEQWEYDNDYRQSYFDSQRDATRYSQEIGIQNNREWLKTGEEGRGSPATVDYESLGASNPSQVERVGELINRPAGSMQEASQSTGQDTDAETKAAAIKEVQKSREQAEVEKKAAKKAENDEDEANWWGKIASNVGDFADAVTPDAVTGPIASGAKAVANSPVGEAAGDAGGWALKQLSRPNHAIASAADAYFGLNDDETRSNLAGGSSLFGKSDNAFSAIANMTLDNINLFGADVPASFDDIDMEGIKKIGSSFKEGWSLNNDTTFRDVIKNNADKNPDFTVQDTLTYQVGGGIGLDVALDPLNLVGVGIVTKPIQIAKEAKNLKRVRGFADEVAALGVPKKPRSILQANDELTYTADDVVEMLGGGRKYNSRAEAASHAKEIQANAVTLSKAMDRITTAPPPLTKRAAAIRKQAERVSKKLNAEKANFASSVITERVASRTAKQEANGALPVGSTKKFAARVEQQHVIKAFQSTFTKGADPAAKRQAFNQALGDEWANHPALTPKDRDWLYDNNVSLLRKANPALHAEHSAILTRAAQTQKALDSAKASGDRSKIAAAQDAHNRAVTARTRSNKKYNRARADIFMRSARARINKNLGTKSPRQKELLAIARQSAREMHNMNISPYAFGRKNSEGKKIGFGPEHQTDFASDGAYVGTANDRIGTEDLAEGEFAQADVSSLDNALTPDLASFSSRGQQLQSAHMAALKEYEDLYPEMVGADQIDAPLMDIPEKFQTEFGDIDPEKVKASLISSKDDLKVEVKDDVQGPEREWLEDFADAFNDQWMEEFSRLNNNAQRGANETARKKGIAEVTGEDIANLVKLGDEDAKHFTEIFRNPDGSAIDLSESAKKFAYPSFEVKGKRIFQNSKELASMVDAPAISRTEKMKKYLSDPSTIKTEKDTTYVFERLKEFGLPVVNNPEAIYNYVTLNNRILRDQFTYKNVAFAMHFKKKHGIPLEDALELRAALIGNTVKSNFTNSTWAKNYPKGMSKARFVHEVTGASGGAALKRVLDGAPFRITPKGDELGFTSPTSRPMSNSNGGWKWLYEHGSDGQLEKALDEAGLPSGATLDDVQSQWYDDMHTYLTGLEPTKLKNKLTGIWESSHGKQVTARKQEIIEKSINNVERAATKSRSENIVAARDTAFDKVSSRIEQGKQTSSLNTSMVLPRSLDEGDTAKAALAAKKEEVLDQIDETKVDLQEAKAVHNTAEIARLEKRIARLKAGFEAEKGAVKKDLEAAREAKKDIQSRLREEAILSVANAEIIAKRKGLAFNVVGKEIPIPTTRAMFAAAEKAGGLPVINKFFEFYKGAFASQAGLLPDEMLYIRNRAISDPSKIIGTHIRTIKNSLGQVNMKARMAATRNYTNGVDDDITRMMDYLISDDEGGFLKHFQNKTPVGDDVLHVREINAYLPEKFRVPPDGDYQNGRMLLAKIMGDASGKVDLKQDPLEAIWVTRIAVEQAMARKAMVHALNETFGVKRGYVVSRKDGSIVGSKKGQAINQKNMIDGAARDTIEKLKNEGWGTIEGMGHSHYFPPDTAESIGRLLKMFEPENVGVVGKLIDEATGIWKTSVTIYNIPGYYIRNGMGEVMSAWLAGVNSVKPYYKSSKVWRYVSHDAKNAEALAQLKPELGLKVETQEQLGKQNILTLQNGRSVDVATVHAWYRDQGLATGFINTEYRHHYSKTKERLHSIKGAQFLSNRNEGLREFNENYEDFYRMAHFIDKLGKAPKNMSDFAAAEWAAKDVRKFHFDYTDFTHAEKAKMLRVFPFYKWTRKALPLMSSMLFAKPGKMMVYPKVMEGMSEGLVNSDDLSDGEEHNGFMPNFHGVVPSSIADMWSYQVGGETGYDAKGQQEYFRMSTPQLDSMNALSHPGNQAESLLSPLIKAPLEQLMGETLGMGLPVANKDGIVDGEEYRGTDGTGDVLDQPGADDKGFLNERMGHLLRMFPPGAMLANYEQGDMDQDAWIRLLSGMGYREVSEQHRNMLKGEGYR